MGRRVIFGHRDGFTLDSVLAIQDLTTLNPVFNALLFAFFLKRAKAPLNLRLVGWLLRGGGRKNRTWGTTLSGLFLVISLLKKWSDAKSRKARNNGTEDVYDWTKEVVVVTGASSGIGARVSQMLGERGIKVVGIDVQRPLYPIPPRMTFYSCDITSRDKVKEVGDQIRGEVGTPTILLNNAGIGRGGTILSVSEKDVRAVMDVNAISHFWTVQEFLPAIIQRNHGHVITIASMASYVVPAGIAAYGMSKAAAMAFHETLTMELLYSYKARKVRTSMVHPNSTRFKKEKKLILSLD